jgi:hypothetical protein
MAWLSANIYKAWPNIDGPIQASGDQVSNVVPYFEPGSQEHTGKVRWGECKVQMAHWSFKYLRRHLDFWRSHSLADFPV